MILLKKPDWDYIAPTHYWETPFGKIEITVNETGNGCEVINLPSDKKRLVHAINARLLFKSVHDAMDYCECHVLSAIEDIYFKDEPLHWLTLSIKGYAHLETPLGFYEVKRGESDDKPCIIVKTPYSKECSIETENLQRAYAYCTDDVYKRADQMILLNKSRKTE